MVTTLKRIIAGFVALACCNIMQGPNITSGEILSAAGSQNEYNDARTRAKLESDVDIVLSTSTTTCTSTNTITTTSTTTSTTTQTTTVPVTTTELQPETSDSDRAEEMVEDIYVETETNEVNYDAEYTEDTYTYTYGDYSWYEANDPNFILLCNAVGHEAGSYWISVYDKELVVEVILNRLNNWGYNSVFDVLAAPYQFTGASSYIYCTWYTDEVSEDCKIAVANVLSGNHYNNGYDSFYGDGYQNYFSRKVW